LRPHLVLISCGVGNSYGHPSHGPYLVPGRAGTDTVPLLRTDLQGSIRLEWGPEGRLSWQAAGEKGEIPRSP
jgi:beta-lactamase superfamily II metal-dependent hydrolase